MIDEILPAGVAAVVDYGDGAGAALLPEEERALGSVSAGRRREFALGRNCARRALCKLDIPAAPILPGPNRQPLWPAGIVGSITHCAGYCAAAVAPQTRLKAIGIDAEVHHNLRAEVLSLVAIDRERDWIDALGATDVCWDCVLFSAKESVFKAWFSLTGKWLGFEDLYITVDPARGSFHARFLVDGPVVDGQTLPGFDGRYLVKRDHVVTLVAVESATR